MDTVSPGKDNKVKDLVVMFVYMTGCSYFSGGDNKSTVALDRTDGRAYKLWLYDDEVLDPCLELQDEISYDEVRQLAGIAHRDGFLEDPARYDDLSASTWQEFTQYSYTGYHYIIADDGEWRMRSCPSSSLTR